MYKLIGYIATNMEHYAEDYLHRKVRVPPKIYVSEQVANRYGKATAVYVNEEENLLWNDSRQNMTTTPGLSFCKDCGGPYSLHHDCKCGNCNG